MSDNKRLRCKDAVRLLAFLITVVKADGLLFLYRGCQWPYVSILQKLQRLLKHVIIVYDGRFEISSFKLSSIRPRSTKALINAKANIHPQRLINPIDTLSPTYFCRLLPHMLDNGQDKPHDNPHPGDVPGKLILESVKVGIDR